MRDNDATESRRKPDVLFALIWDGLVDVLGSAATAAMLRRAAKRAATKQSSLQALSVCREGFEYSYALPEVWAEDEDQALADLRALANELSPLLIELTGPVVVRRLNGIRELECSAIIFGTEKSS